MKKILYIFAVVALVATFTSCKKDGVYKPGKKIARIYNEISGNVDNAMSKTLASSWTWDGNKLARIDHFYTNGNLYYSEVFTYDGRKLVQVDDYTYGEKIIYTYDGSKLVQGEYYDDGNLETIITIEHDGSKVSAIEMLDLSKKQDRHLNPLTGILPQDIVDQISMYSENLEMPQPKGSAVTRYEFTWDGKNISQYVIIVGGLRQTYELSYDSHRNPFCNFLGLNGMNYGVGEYASRNNVLNIVYTFQGGGESGTGRATYNYEYNGDYPTLCWWDYSANERRAIYYEYAN